MTDKELKAKILAEIEKKIKVLSPFTHQGSDTYGKVIRQLESLVSFINSIPEEPVSSVWHDSNKEQPKEGSTVAIWNGENGEILARCVNVYPDRLWAYMDDLLHKQEELISEELDGAAEKYAYELFLSIGAANTETELAFKAGAQWQKQQTISKAVEWLQRNIDSRDWLMEFRKVLEE